MIKRVDFLLVSLFLLPIIDRLIDAYDEQTSLSPETVHALRQFWFEDRLNGRSLCYSQVYVLTKFQEDEAGSNRLIAALGPRTGRRKLKQAFDLLCRLDQRYLLAYDHPDSIPTIPPEFYRLIA